MDTKRVAFEAEQFIDKMLAETPNNWTIASKRMLMLYAMAYVFSKPISFRDRLIEYLGSQLDPSVISPDAELTSQQSD